MALEQPTGEWEYLYPEPEPPWIPPSPLVRGGGVLGAWLNTAARFLDKLGSGGPPRYDLGWTPQTVRCTAAGFVAVTYDPDEMPHTRRYAWAEVTDTRYAERTRSIDEDTSVIIPCYTVRAGGGTAIAIASNDPALPGLIAVVNRLAPQVPHEWIPVAEAAGRTVLAWERGYCRVAR